MKYYRVFLILSGLLYFTGCADIKTNVISPPPPSAKLRVLVIAISGDIKGVYKVSNEEFTNRTYQNVSIFLQRNGIYEVIPESEVKAVLGNHDYNFARWKFRDYSLVKEAGKALYADYAFIFERSMTSKGVTGFEFRLVSFSSGMVFEASDYITRMGSFAAFSEKSPLIITALYRKIFNEAKADMLTTAIRKGRIAGPNMTINESVKHQQELVDAKQAVIPGGKQEPADKRETVAPVKELKDKEAPVTQQEPSKIIKEDAEKKLAMHMPLIKDNKDNKLVVYDFDSTYQFNIASLILSEALREELFKLGKFNLVNREDLTKAMNELQLQQSGFVDEKEKVKLGKWLAANQSVTGKFFELGKSVILQTRLTNIETMKIMSMASIKCEQGNEEELLKSMETLARKLAGF